MRGAGRGLRCPQGQRAPSSFQCTLPPLCDRPIALPRLPARSGGQRKRVNIGLEVCVKPSLLFLDEPTSGLDSTAAQDIMGALTRMTRLGMNVVAGVNWCATGVSHWHRTCNLHTNPKPFFFFLFFLQ